MRIFLPYKKRKEILCAANEALAHRGHTCVLYPVSSAASMREAFEKGRYDVVLGAEASILSKLTTTVPKVYLATDFFCGEKLRRTDCALVLIPHAELSFDFIDAGAREKQVRVCGVPLCEKNLGLRNRDEACKSLGLSAEKKTFTFFTDGVPTREIKAAVHAAGRLCPETQVVVMSGDAARTSAWQTAFSKQENVFVLPTEIPLGMRVADAVFLPALPSVVCTAARAEKVCMLFHVGTPQCRKNAAFLEARGAAFGGKTAADTVSYAMRLLEGERLRANLLRAQEKAVLREPERTLCEEVERIAQTQKKH